MSRLSEQGQAILEEFDLTIMPDITFDRRFQTDPETGYPIPRYSTKLKRMDHGMIEVFYIGIPTELAAGITGGSLACSPTLRSEHDLLVWAAKNESTIREEMGDE